MLVYFARCQEFTKIGYARDTYTRIKVLATSSPWPVALAAQMMGGEREERLLHVLFRQLHHRNEWFRHEGKLVDLVDTLAGIPDPVAAREHAAQWYYDNADLSPLLFIGIKPQARAFGRIPERGFSIRSD